MEDLGPLANCPRFCLHGNMILNAGVEVGTWHPDQNRIEWSWDSLGVDSALIDMAQKEAALWDGWASGQKQETSNLPREDKERFSIPGWLKRYPNIKGAFEGFGLSPNLCGMNVLDIGGSGKDMVYWLRDKPERVDQIEVSPKSQLLCQRRVQDVLQGSSETPIYYHTMPAEHLPFDDGVFDFVFSRSTLHHCERPRIFAEIVRVMKPGGILLFIEPYLSRPIYWLMVARRKILRKDRGTDNPLRRQEIKVLEESLSSDRMSAVAFYNRNLLSHLFFGGRKEDWNKTRRSMAMQISFLGKKERGYQPVGLTP